MNSSFSIMQWMRGRLFSEWICALLIYCSFVHAGFAADPSWWQSRGVKSSAAPVDDYAVVNQGQFKNFVRAAIDEMNAHLPNGAGQTLNDLLASWRTATPNADAHAVVNQGQVKNVIKQVYTRLQEVGYATAYPWSHGERAAQDYALANIGQLKNLLNFDLSRDADRDGIADWLKGVNGTADFDPSTWLPISTPGSIFEDSQHHSRLPDIGFSDRGSPTNMPANLASLKNDPVTSIPGEFKVGQDGSASYTVRIETPKGIANVEPGITLEYNSNTGNGIAGVGWGIGGVTVINRGPATFEVDGFYDPPDFDDNDRFYLDGERLLCVNGTYGTDGSEYRTEKEQFSRVIYHKPNDSGGWFELWTKAGLRMEFGNCPTACINTICPGGTARTFTWAVCKVSDNLGNYWRVVYDDTGIAGPPAAGTQALPDYAPSYILFTGTSSSLPAHRIDFSYEFRPDVTEGWLLGFSVVKNRRLRQVVVSSLGTALRTYSLEYQTSATTGRSLLKKLHLNAGGPIEDEDTPQPWRVASATEFTWDEGSAGWSDSLYDGNMTPAEKTVERAKIKTKLPYPRQDSIKPGDYWPLLQRGYTWPPITSTSMSEYSNAGVPHIIPMSVDDLNGDGLNDMFASHKSPLYLSYYYTYDYDFPSGVPYPILATPSKIDSKKIIENKGLGRWQETAQSDIPWFSTVNSQPSFVFDFTSDGVPDILSLDANLPKMAASHGIPYRVFLSNGALNSLGVHNPTTRSYMVLPELWSSYDTSTNPVGTWLGKQNGESGWTAATSTQATEWSLPQVPIGATVTTQNIPYYYIYSYYPNWPYGLPPGAQVTTYYTPGWIPILTYKISWSTLPYGNVSFYNAEVPDLGWRPVDLDADGHTDLIRAGQGDITSTPMGGGRQLCFGLRNRGPLATGNKWELNTSGIWQLPLPLVNKQGDKDMGRRLIDVNGDRLPDFVYQRERPVPAGQPAWGTYDKYELAVYINGGKHAGWIDGGTSWTIPGEALTFGDLSSYGRGFMDINGDSLPDYVVSWKYKDANNVWLSQNKAFLNTGAGWTADLESWHLPLPLQVAEYSHLQKKVATQTFHRFMEDVNGDGRPELIDAWKDNHPSMAVHGGQEITQPKVYFHLSTDGDDADTLPDGWRPSSTWTIPAAFLPRSRAFSQVIANAQNAGYPYYTEALVPPVEHRGYLEDWTENPIQLADLDGDQRNDLLLATTAGTTAYYNTGRSEKITAITNGLGVPITVSYQTLPRLGTEPDTVANPRRYVRGTKPAYADSDSVPAAWVVTDYTTPNGIGDGGTVTSYYRYGGLRTKDQRSLGFEWLEVRTSNSPVIQYTEYYQTPKDFIGLPKVAESYYMKNGTTKVVLSSATNQYATLNTATALEGLLTPKPLSRFIYASSSATQKRDPDGISLGTTATTYAYDTWGNLETQTATSTDGAEVINSNTYEPPVTTPTAWIHGRVKTASVTNRAPTAERSSSPDVTKSSSFTYHATTGLLETETVHPGTPKAVTKTHYRDAFGNITKTITTAAGETEKLVSETWYDPTGRFPIASKNALGHTAVTEYDYTRSLATRAYMAFQSTPPTPDSAHSPTPPAVPSGTQYTTTSYDDWGTSLVTTSADGLKACRFTRAFTSPALPAATYYVYEQAQGGPPSITYYDRHHRVLLTESTGFDGTPILQSITYNAKGQATHKTAPYFHHAAPSAVKTTVYHYDDFDRQWKTTSPDGTISYATYAGLTATSTVLGTERGTAKNIVKTATHDEHGRLRISTDERGNTVTFTYTADGLPSTATTAYADGSPSTQVTTTYDPLTREKKTVTDPNTGTSTSTYDGFGRLVTTQDAMGVQHHFTYDILGRSKTRQTPETDTTWTYDVVTPTSNGLGKAHSTTHTARGSFTDATRPTQYEETTYDTLGRVVSTKLALSNQPAFNGTYTSSVTYDALGRADTATDPGGLTTQSEYNAYGFKSGLRTPHPTLSYLVLWRAYAYDAEGKLLQERHGNGVTTDNTYHPLTGTLQTSTSHRPGLGGAAGRDLQKLELHVNNLGNVEWRKSTTYDTAGTGTTREENFHFDLLNRLTTSATTGQATQTFGYKDNGNIHSKTGIGTYTYDTVKTHAVSSVAGSDGISHAYDYDADGRMTTETVKKAGEADRLIRRITYTSFHQPSVITHYASPKLITDRSVMGGDARLCSIAFHYDSDLQRLIQIKTKGLITTRVLYLGAYEVREMFEGAPSATSLLEREQRSSFGNGALVRLATRGTSLTIPSVKLEFSLTDHLGSTSAVHDENGDVKKNRGQVQEEERHSYDAWGARRDKNWAPSGPMLGHSSSASVSSSSSSSNSSSTSTTTANTTSSQTTSDPPQVASSQPRGFTGHEMLDDVGLVHMNGRLYDSSLGRFCSADPLVQEAENAQNYNRYTYVLNNPLNAIDPSGYSFLKKFFRALIAIVLVIIVVALILVTYGGGFAYLQVLAGAWSAGGISGVGTVIAASTTLQIAAAAILGGSFAAINAAVRGGNTAEVLRAAAHGAITGAISGGVASGIGNAFQGLQGFGARLAQAAAHGVAGGAMTEAQGGSFKDGFIGSLIGSGVNYLTGGLLPGMDRVGGLGGIVLRTTVASISGGVATMLAGGKFMEGAYSAAFFHLFNDEMHNVNMLTAPFTGELSVSDWVKAVYWGQMEGSLKGGVRFIDEVIPFFDPGASLGLYDPATLGGATAAQIADMTNPLSVGGKVKLGAAGLKILAGTGLAAKAYNWYNRPTKLYALVDKTTGTIFKFGETSRGVYRYSKAYLHSLGVRYEWLAQGTKQAMRQLETKYIKAYKKTTGGMRPPGNFSDH